VRWTRAPLLLLLLLAVGVPPRAAGDEDTYEEALEHYESRIDRPPLATRLGGIRRLAATQDPRALEVLADRYAKPRVPKDHERYLIAAAIGRWFTDARHVEALAKLRRKHRHDENAWLWFQASRAEALSGDVSGLAASILDAKERPFLRAALLERLGAEERPETLPLVATLAGEDLPRKGVARTLLLESAASVLAALRDTDAREPFARAARAVVDLLARDDVEARTRLVIARHLAYAFRVERVTTDHEFWRRVLASEEPVAREGTTVTGRPRFFGLEASGTRVVYLVDLSDSMLEPLTDREREDARRIPRVVEGEAEDVDWSRIRSRFDLARAYLKQSLEALDDEHWFMVVGFGDRAEPFRATRRLVKATRQNVREAVKELEALTPGRATPARPHGTLRGATNVHGAFLLAYRALVRKDVDEHEHVAEAALEDGCDTIFLFGDGQPTEDDFAASDRFDGGRITTDTEKGTTGQARPGPARYYGPYRAVGNLVQDVQRMNLFRKAEIHAIAMGEADNDLMRRLAAVGLGRYRSIGFLGREGRVNAWWIVGPFPAPDVAAWERSEDPEREVRLDRPVRIEERRAHWRRVFTSHAEALVDLDRELGPRDRVAAYAYAEVVVDKGGKARLEIGSDDGVRVWLGGKVVHTCFKERRLEAGEDKVDVTLEPGVNRLLVKVCDAKGPWRFCVRIVDEQGRPLDFRLE